VASSCSLAGCLLPLAFRFLTDATMPGPTVSMSCSSLRMCLAAFYSAFPVFSTLWHVGQRWSDVAWCVRSLVGVWPTFSLACLHRGHFTLSLFTRCPCTACSGWRCIRCNRRGCTCRAGAVLGFGVVHVRYRCPASCLFFLWVQLFERHCIVCVLHCSYGAVSALK
jgi:hypothetical protein